MLDGIEMDVIDMSIQIALIADDMVPESVLPQPTPDIPAVTCGTELALEAMDGA